MKYQKRIERLGRRREDNGRLIKELIKRPEWDEVRARKAFRCPGSLNK